MGRRARRYGLLSWQRNFVLSTLLITTIPLCSQQERETVTVVTVTLLSIPEGVTVSEADDSDILDQN